MAEISSLSPPLRQRTHPLAVHSLKGPLDFYPNGIVCSFTLIDLAIRFPAYRQAGRRFLIEKQILLFHLINHFRIKTNMRV